MYIVSILHNRHLQRVNVTSAMTRDTHRSVNQFATISDRHVLPTSYSIGLQLYPATNPHFPTFLNKPYKSSIYIYIQYTNAQE